MRLLALLVTVSAIGAGCHRAKRVDDATRPLEARLGAADRHRPFKAGRGNLPLDEQAALERRGEWQALADAELLAGRVDAAAATLDKAPASPSVDADRAVVALLRGDLEGALDRLAGVLARAPGSGAALWNRALVLRELGLVRGAAAAFDAVAALGEPGWSTEAHAQALALRTLLDKSQQEWKQVKAAGKALIESGAPPPPAVLQRAPSYMRHFLYHALRAAPSVDRVRALAPLAATLDARQGGDTLASLVARTAARDLKKRAPLAATYTRISTNPSLLDKSAAEAYLAALRRAHEDDLLLGALILYHQTGPEMLALARATNDPWYRALAADYEAQALADRDEPTQAESLLLPALDECRAHQLDYRCVHLESTLTDIYRLQHRNQDAQRLGKLALAHGREHAREPLDIEFEVLMRLGDTAREREGFALMEAFLDEGVRANPDSCEGRRWAYDMIASAHLFRLEPRAARAAIDRSPRCDQPISLERANVIVDLDRFGLGGADAATLVADLDGARKSLAPGLRAWADVFAARFLLSRNRAAAARLFDRALAAAAAAPRDVEARKARAYAHLTRAVDAGLRDDAAGALAQLASDVDAPAPARCALAVAVDDERALAVARGPDGNSAVFVDRKRTSPALDVDQLVPPQIRAQLVGCEEVAVFAPPPVHGLPGLLPPELAWSYRLRAPLKALEREPRARRVVIANPSPPPSLALPRLADWRSSGGDVRAVVVEGAAATPTRVLAEIADATEVEVHAHGLLDLGLSDASVLALSPEANGRFALSAREVARASLRARPIVILAACRAAQAAAYRHEPWGLPLAFVQAGASAVFASPAPIGDADAGPFFAALLARLRDHPSPARALRDERMRVLSKDAGHWARQLLVFQ